MDLRYSYRQILELRGVEVICFDVDWMTRCVAGERQAGESIGVSVLMRVPVLDTVPVSGNRAYRCRRAAVMAFRSFSGLKIAVRGL